MTTTEHEESCGKGYVVRPISSYCSQWGNKHVQPVITYLNMFLHDKNLEYYPRVIKRGSRQVFDPAQYDIRKLFFNDGGFFWK
jgi:hypothetical protein